MSNFSDIGIDPIEGAEIFEVLGIYDQDLQDPRRFSMVREIAHYLKGQPNKRFAVNKIMKPGVDRIEHFWTYIQLRKEMGNRVDGLKNFATEFTDEIQQEINEGYLSNEAMEKMERELQNLNASVAEQKRILENKIKEIKNTETAIAERERAQEEKAVKIKMALGKIDKLKEELKAYE